MAERLSLFVTQLSFAREAERLSSLRLEYDLDGNWTADRRGLSGLAFGITWYHSHIPARQFSPRSARFEVSEVMAPVMRDVFRFLPSSAGFR
jgi:hypothetical protein